MSEDLPGGPGSLHQFVPQTSDDVPARLREALDLAVTGKLRGVVVLLAFHDRTPMRQFTAGTITIGDAMALLEYWKHEMLHQQTREVSPET